MSEQHAGWTNKQTWNINLMYGEIFANMVKEQKFDDLDHVMDSFRSLMDELEFQGLQEGSLAWQAVGEYLDRVDWEQLADHYFDKGLEEEEAEESEESNN